MVNVQLESKIKEISPFSAEEFVPAMRRVADHPLTRQAHALLFSEIPFEQIREKALSLRTVEEFQSTLIRAAIESMLKKTSGGVVLAGTENIDPTTKYTFISNHRDILLDPTLFTLFVFFAGHTTPKICLGDNLLRSDWIIDLVKLNKGVTVKRKLPPRELLIWSRVLSELIRREVTSKRDSVWIAQREGRAKDGNDVTQPAVIKMLSIAGEGPLSEKMRELRIVPVAIAYEYEPSDIARAWQLLVASREGEYIKLPDEDLKAMVGGVTGDKGRIRIQIGKELAPEFWQTLAGAGSTNDQLRAVALQLDRQIHRIYHLWPSNWIAADLLAGNAIHAAHYTDAQKKYFVDRMRERLDQVPATDALRDELRGFFLKMYANPVSNAEKAAAPLV